MILLHGTTRYRASRIIAYGPYSNFREPGGQAPADGFSMNVEAGPFLFGRLEDYALGKAEQFPDEEGPVILALDVPDEIIRRAANAWYPIDQGLVQFDPGSGLEELAAAWPDVAKTVEIREVP